MKIIKHNKPDKDFVCKSKRQAAFIESCNGISVKDAVSKAKLFQNFKRSDFQIIRVVG